MNNELINIIFHYNPKGSGKKNKNNLTRRETMLKINTFQNLTQFLVYFKEYINICKLKKAVFILY